MSTDDINEDPMKVLEKRFKAEYDEGILDEPIFEDDSYGFEVNSKSENPYAPRTELTKKKSTPIKIKVPRRKPTDVQPVLNVPEGSIHDWFSEMARNDRYAYDVELHETLVDIVKHSFERQTSIQMVVNEIGDSIASLGLNVNFQYRALLKDSINIMSLDILRQLVNVFGMNRYSDEIMVRMVEKVYGTSGALKKIETDEKESKRNLEEESLSIARKTHKTIVDLLQIQRQQSIQSKPKLDSLFTPKRYSNTSRDNDRGRQKPSSDEVDDGDLG